VIRSSKLPGGENEYREVLTKWGGSFSLLLRTGEIEERARFVSRRNDRRNDRR
jgi:hypothetical protein